jgi:hypothetical protein
VDSNLAHDLSSIDVALTEGTINISMAGAPEDVKSTLSTSFSPEATLGFHGDRDFLLDNVTAFAIHAAYDAVAGDATLSTAERADFINNRYVISYTIQPSVIGIHVSFENHARVGSDIDNCPGRSFFFDRSTLQMRRVKSAC